MAADTALLLAPQPRLTADSADVLASRVMVPQSAVDRAGAPVGLKFTFLGALCAYANSWTRCFQR
jgi:hypothetical protein